MEREKAVPISNSFAALAVDDYDACDKGPDVSNSSSHLALFSALYWNISWLSERSTIYSLL